MERWSIGDPNGTTGLQMERWKDGVPNGTRERWCSKWNDGVTNRLMERWGSKWNNGVPNRTMVFQMEQWVQNGTMGSEWNNGVPNRTMKRWDDGMTDCSSYQQSFVVSVVTYLSSSIYQGTLVLRLSQDWTIVRWLGRLFMALVLFEVCRKGRTWWGRKLGRPLMNWDEIKWKEKKTEQQKDRTTEQHKDRTTERRINRTTEQRINGTTERQHDEKTER